MYFKQTHRRALKSEAELETLFTPMFQFCLSPANWSTPSLLSLLSSFEQNTPLGLESPELQTAELSLEMAATMMPSASNPNATKSGASKP